MNTMETIDFKETARQFNAGRVSVGYQMHSGGIALLFNLGGKFGFCYLGQPNRSPKFQGITATQAIENALKAKREIILTTVKPTLTIPVFTQP